jgi:hypothetical protein
VICGKRRAFGTPVLGFPAYRAMSGMLGRKYPGYFPLYDDKARPADRALLWTAKISCRASSAR